MNTIPRKLAVQMIRQMGNQFFTVTVKRRSDGGISTMNCRLGVTKHLTGAGPKYNAKAKQLISVYALDRKAYRSIAEEGIETLSIKGTKFAVVDS